MAVIQRLDDGGTVGELSLSAKIEDLRRPDAKPLGLPLAACTLDVGAAIPPSTKN